MSDGSGEANSWRERVVQFLESQSNAESYGLTRRKVFERAELVEQDLDSGQVVFEMERHHPALGAENPRGSGMHSFITTHYRYTFDPAGWSLKQSRTDTKPRLELNTRTTAEDFARHLGFEFEHIGGRRYRCRETCLDVEWEVSCKREALELTCAVAELVCWDSSIDDIKLTLDAPLDPGIAQKIVEELEENFVEIVRGTLDEAWEDFMEKRRVGRRPCKPEPVKSTRRSRKASRT